MPRQGTVCVFALIASIASPAIIGWRNIWYLCQCFKLKVAPWIVYVGNTQHITLQKKHLLTSDGQFTGEQKLQNILYFILSTLWLMCLLINCQWLTSNFTENTFAIFRIKPRLWDNGQELDSWPGCAAESGNNSYSPHSTLMTTPQQ